MQMQVTPVPRLVEIAPACLVAGTGMIFAGNYLDWIKHHQASQFDAHFLAIIPPLIGLKGNLEVALSSHLATVSNLRSGAHPQSIHLFLRTLVYTLIQGIFGASLISLIGATLYAPRTSVEQTFYHAANLSAVSTLACVLAICTLSILVFGLTSCCQCLGADPDNIVPPVAAALGDLATVALLFSTGQCYIKFPLAIVSLSLLCTAIILLSGFFYFSKQSHSGVFFDMQSLDISWGTLLASVAPLSCAVVISSLSGQLLARFAHRLHNLARLQIAINGVGGCFGSVLISRMVTRIHARQRKYTSPASSRKLTESEPSSEPSSSRSVTTSADTRHSLLQTSNLLMHQTAADASMDAYQTGRLVLMMCIPIHSILAFLSFVLLVFTHRDNLQATGPFSWSTAGTYLLASFLQTFAVLHFAKWIVLAAWRKLSCAPNQVNCGCTKPVVGRQPSLASLDLYAIALTTSFGDLIGTILLTMGLAWLQT